MYDRLGLPLSIVLYMFIIVPAFAGAANGGVVDTYENATFGYDDGTVTISGEVIDMREPHPPHNKSYDQLTEREKRGFELVKRTLNTGVTAFNPLFWLYFETANFTSTATYNSDIHLSQEQAEVVAHFPLLAPFVVFVVQLRRWYREWRH